MSQKIPMHAALKQRIRELVRSYFYSIDEEVDSQSAAEAIRGTVVSGRSLPKDAVVEVELCHDTYRVTLRFPHTEFEDILVLVDRQ